MPAAISAAMFLRVILAVVMVACAVAALSSPARADLDDELKKAGWDEITFDDKSPNLFSAINAEHGRVDGVRVVSQSTVSIAFLNVTNDLKKRPKLTWQWRVDTKVIDTDLTREGGDDRSLAIYVAFPYQPEHASFGEKLKRAAVEALKGKDTPGRVLTYVWGGGAAKGAMTENPYAGSYGAFIFQRTPRDPSGQWLTEEVDLRADFIKAFGHEPASPVYIGIGTDTDDTTTRAEAQVQGIRFIE
ncbi:MAG: DUF3047 domain-containing protein [Alphaproteobacteria bacterium]|nr:DUF3047 domain-containing protein [Alphaproteobacteria bacterium]